MRIHILKSIYEKEMLDLIRDRRTLISMVVVPVLIFPIMMVGATRVMGIMEQKSKDEAKSLAVGVKATDPHIAEALRKAGIPVADGPADLRAAVEKKTFGAGVEETPGTPPLLHIYSDDSNPGSRGIGDRIRAAMADMKDERIRQSLRASGIAESVLTPFQVKRINVAPARKMSGMIWGSMLGYLLLLLMFSGGMYPVIDMTAGEKERRTLETLLSSPAGRDEIVLGKMLAAMTAIAMTAALTLASIVISVRSNGISVKNEEVRAMLQTIPMDWQTVSLIALTLVPLIVLAASSMIAIAIHARSFKEGTSYLMPVMFLVIFPALLGGMPGMELTPLLCLVPVFNASQLIRSVMLGEWSTTMFAITLAANVVYGTIAFVIAQRKFNQEEVLFRT